MFAAGDDVVVTRWTGSGTHSGELMGIAPTRKKVKVPGVWIHRFSGGKIVESWNAWDTLGMLTQLGVNNVLGTTGGDRVNLGLHPAEFYTNNGNLDPATLKGASIQDLTGQGWVLQKAWDKDPSIRKDFLFVQPGQFNQILVVWDAFAAYENDRWNHLEIFGAEEPAKIGETTKP